MSTYQVAIGFDQEGSLADLAIPWNFYPKCPGIEYGILSWGGDGLKREDGYRSGELVFGYITAAHLATFMTQVGLSDTTLSAEITIALPLNITRTFTPCNAVIEAPQFPEGANYSGTGRYTEVHFPLSQIRVIES